MSDLAGRVGQAASVSPFVDLSFSGVRVEAFTEEGKECCADCDKGIEPVPYTIQGGSLAGDIGLVVVAPGFGLARNLPEKEISLGFSGSIKASGKVIFGLSGKAVFGVKASFEDKMSVCEEGDCQVVTVTAGGAFNVGVRGEVEGKIDSCDSDGDECNEILVLKGNAQAVFALPLSAEAKRMVGGDGCGGSCIGYQVGGVNFVANAGYQIVIGRIYNGQYSAKVSVDLADGFSQACNL